ncbi:serine hydrolase domain-containing protein [Candidatus Neptunochlamydia vexilliferae]|uniref:serine hydrolase domain-containing protein n=1 Tax=Candidatus Neptunichlamydia vexilliferae TaxID=1651774 RepID=UPI001891F086|nr:serine hydrolase domain-containing protein [Candidatus Neptunochlamydia vexilliferae]
MKLKRKILVFLLPALLFSGEMQKTIQKKVTAYRDQYSPTGIAVIAIGEDEGEPFQQIVTRGTLSLTTTIPVNPFTEFRIGPITQLFTASILAYFVQEGQVSLNDPVSKFVPKSTVLPTYNGKEITLGDLATHTSGLPDMPYSLSSRSSFSVSQMYRFLSKYQLPREPGTECEYSNFGYAFLASLLSRLSKRSFPELMKDQILHPLNLDDTVFTLSAEQKKRLATGYEQARGIYPLLSEKVYSIFIGSGGLYSMPRNMLTFLSFCMGREKTSLNAILPIMETPYHTFQNFKMALGWQLRSIEEGDCYCLGGSLFGFAMYIGYLPDKGVGVVILTNQGDFDLTSFGEELLSTMAK